MKKLILLVLSFVLFFAFGCNDSSTTLVMYVAHCPKTELKQMPKNNSLTLDTLEIGKKVLFEKADKNGYSKVTYRGKEGYILSKHLSTENPKDLEMKKKGNSQPSDLMQTPPPEIFDEPVEVQLTDDEVEEYVVNIVRPIFNEINSNPDNYENEPAGEFTVWYDSEGRMVKKSCPQNVGGATLGREYYYNAETGKLVFAFLYHDLAEYRLYFYKDTLVRFISNADSVVVNNPTSEEALAKAGYVLYEAY